MSDFANRLWICKEFLIVGPIIGFMCAQLSVYVVLRRMALISEGVSHAGFGGIGVAILVGYFIPTLTLGSHILQIDGPVGQQIITGIFCMATAFLIGFVTRRKRVTEDSAIGIFLAATVAMGQLLMSIRHALPDVEGRPRINFNVESQLFGNFASVSSTDVWVAATAMVIVFTIFTALYHQFLYTTLDEEMARINGVNTRLINALLLMMISLVIVICVRMVGFLMITALTIIPGATASMLTRRFGGVLVLSLVIGTLGTTAATFLAVTTTFGQYSPGPLVVLTLFSIFAVVWILRHFFKPKVQETVPVAAPPESNPSSFGSGHVH